MEGWIKLHRKLMQSETFVRLTAIQKLIAIYIILNANHSDGVWIDHYKNIEVPVKRGQLITSRNKIVKEWFNGDKDVTEQKVRTCLDKLERLGFLTKSPANDYTVITVHNYGVYQDSQTDDNQEDNQALTKPKPSINQAITTNKNVENEKKVKDISAEIENFRSLYSPDLLALIDQYLDFIRETRKSRKISDSIILKIMTYFGKYSAARVEHAIRAHMNNIEKKSAPEEYTFGIIRNTTEEDAQRKLQGIQQGGKTPQKGRLTREQIQALEDGIYNP
ncbi:hypothetical protein [Paenibacillus glucanolyticus]|uniref:hypothetical protein n=1 Tax=Paenibacillus glucanolyticus TaxID=59843 RepID=UPI00128D73D9|nr:hypothetical protein [Paenibacillus glucanolyticus]MPY15819.1 hypothetical protein [Paenibacillus glucanolyticus]